MLFPRIVNTYYEVLYTSKMRDGENVHMRFERTRAHREVVDLRVAMPTNAEDATAIAATDDDDDEDGSCFDALL